MTNKSGPGYGLEACTDEVVADHFRSLITQGTNKLKTSYGIGLADKFVELGLAVQTYDSFLPVIPPKDYPSPRIYAFGSDALYSSRGFCLLISGYLYFRTLPSLSKGRRALLFSLRSIGIYILLLLLLSPVLHFIHNRRALPEILILTDISESMDLRSGSGTKSDFFKPCCLQWRKASLPQDTRPTDTALLMAWKAAATIPNSPKRCKILPNNVNSQSRSYCAGLGWLAAG